MPAYVDVASCDSCHGRHEPECVRICPADIIKLDRIGRKAEVIEPDCCWECFACVKACPRDAMAVRGAADTVPLGASLRPSRGLSSISWSVTFRNGAAKEFEFPIRTTAWGSIELYADPVPAAAERLHSIDLCGENIDGVNSNTRVAAAR